MDYDSESSGADDVETGVTLGYASKDPTGDDVSQLGGHPTWLDQSSPPPGNFAKCKVCSGYLNLLLQLNGDLPDRFPGHERRLYLFGCRKKACRRKDGAFRGLRSTRIDKDAGKTAEPQPKQDKTASPPPSKPQPSANLGETIFGVKSPGADSLSKDSFSTPANGPANPFSTPSSAAPNPFATSSLAAKPAQKPSETESLAQTFAEKARISANSPSTPASTSPPEAWPETSRFPAPYPAYFIDADKEYLEPEPEAVPSQSRITELDAEGGSSSAADDKAAFESSMDRTFQRFADRMAHNPKQVLRYEFSGQPLLYSKKDVVGKTWPRVSRCGKCGAERTFELQLTPHAITELETDDDSLDGMDWGTIILAVCSWNCEGWTEEWVGVQWEELAAKK